MDGSIKTLTPELSIKTQRGGLCDNSMPCPVVKLDVAHTCRHVVVIRFINMHTKTLKSELGADIILTFDECTPYHVDKSYTEASMERSHRWELR
jgi:hypothetical protein